ncbi:hypothetical protein [Chromobacterium sp. LK11]|uniref:hypothetical protein n=1 Tax=Chromobacterium sp. LK11 TaxID=1628212 RepID=UPI000A4D58CA|nr:hypothetical protein [Chromobacterium sp. LK11]
MPSPIHANRTSFSLNTATASQQTPLQVASGPLASRLRGISAQTIQPVLRQTVPESAKTLSEPQWRQYSSRVAEKLTGIQQAEMSLGLAYMMNMNENAGQLPGEKAKALEQLLARNNQAGGAASQRWRADTQKEIELLKAADAKNSAVGHTSIAYANLDDSANPGYVRAYMAVYAKSTGDNFKDVGQNPDGSLNASGKALWIGFGTPHRALGYLMKYKMAGAESPLIRSFLVDKQFLEQQLGKTESEPLRAKQSAAEKKQVSGQHLMNVDTKEFNQFEVKTTARREQVEVLQIRDKKTGELVEKTIKKSKEGESELIQSLLAHAKPGSLETIGYSSAQAQHNDAKEGVFVDIARFHQQLGFDPEHGAVAFGADHLLNLSKDSKGDWGFDTPTVFQDKVVQWKSFFHMLESLDAPETAELLADPAINERFQSMLRDVLSANRLMPDDMSFEPDAPKQSDTEQARAQQLARPLTAGAQKLQQIIANAETQSPLRQLEAISRKNSFGQFELNQQLLRSLNYNQAWDRQLGVELNEAYLQLLQALAQDHGQTVAEKTAKLLRSPDNGKLTLGKLTGYYQSVLEHGKAHPELLDALKSLLNTIDSQASPATMAKLTAKIQKQLDKMLRERAGQMPAAQALTLSAINDRLENIKERGLALASRQAAAEAQREAFQQQQQQRSAQLQQVASHYGLEVPRYMRDQLKPIHLELAAALHADFERQAGQLRASSQDKQNIALGHARQLAQGYNANTEAKQAQLTQLQSQQDKAGQKTLKQELKANAKALDAVHNEASRISGQHRRELDSALSALTRAGREQLAKQLLASGVYLEHPAAEKAALERCLQSDAAQRIVAKAVDEAKDFSGQVNKHKAIELASRRLVDHVMSDSFFREKMSQIGQSFANHAQAAPEAGASAAAIPSLRQAQSAAGSEAERQVAETAQQQVKQQAKTVAEELARKQAETSARQEAERVAKQQAEQAAQEQAERRAREHAESAARKQAEQAAREQAERAAREQAASAARQQAEQAARQQAEAAARQQVEAAARARAEELWVRDFNRKMEPADTNLLHARLGMLKDEHEEIRVNNALENAPRVPKASPASATRVRQAEALTADGKPRIL